MVHWFGGTGQTVRRVSGLEEIHYLYGDQAVEQKGVLKNENAVVTSLVTREEVQAKESDELWSGPSMVRLPGFLTAFLGGKNCPARKQRT